jgi:phosphoribosylformylglycinamidine (FGAM) synthase-like enzyme
MVLASGLTLDVDLDTLSSSLSTLAALFSESTGRIVLTARAADHAALDEALSGHGLHRIGVVDRGATGGQLRLHRSRRLLADLEIGALRHRFHAGLDA